MLVVERINELLEQRGWGPGELAQQSGVAYDTIYKLRTGERARPSADIVARLALALGCSVEYLLGLTDSPTFAPNDMPELLQNLLETAKTLPESRQRDLIMIAQAYQAAGEPTPEVMELLLEKIEELGGEDSLNQILDLLEAQLPFESPPHRRRASKKSP